MEREDANGGESPWLDDQGSERLIPSHGTAPIYVTIPKYTTIYGYSMQERTTKIIMRETWSGAAEIKVHTKGEEMMMVMKMMSEADEPFPGTP